MFIRALYLCLVGLALTACTSCAYSFTGADVTVRSPNAEMGAVVKITSKCGDGGGYGTGVVVSKDRILTAKHVVTCEDGNDPSVTIDTGDGVDREVEVEVLLPVADIARLRVVNGDLGHTFTPVEIGPRPVFNDKLCMGTAVPRLGYHCGLTQPGSNGRDIRWDWLTEFGNSGSGVYHDGKLIGILVSLMRCQDGIPCVGGISPLQDFKWLIP